MENNPEVEAKFKVVPAYPPGTWAWALVCGDILVTGGEYKPDLEETARLLNGEFEALSARVKELETEGQRLRNWVNDLQSGMYVNCVYCGHQYGPKETTPVSMADVLKEHIKKCPEHPMSKLQSQLSRMEGALIAMDNFETEHCCEDCPCDYYKEVVKETLKKQALSESRNPKQ